MRKNISEKDYKIIQDSIDNNTVIVCTVYDVSDKGFVLRLLSNVEGFIHYNATGFDKKDCGNRMLGRKIEAKALRINDNNSVIVSRKELIEIDYKKRLNELFDNAIPGTIIKGTVKSIKDFGVFVDIGGIDGMIHVSDLSHDRVDVNTFLKVGEQVVCVVLSTDRIKKNVSLGLKQLDGLDLSTLN